jgi:hypothetical protein
MKATDLRIGNWVNLYDDYNSEVTGLTNTNKVWCVNNPHNENCAWNPDKIKPIPLTEGWLKKLGFEKALNGWWDETENWCCNNNDFYLGAKMFLAKVDYVHQLQNLYFALTGKELTI